MKFIYYIIHIFITPKKYQVSFHPYLDIFTREMFSVVIYYLLTGNEVVIGKSQTEA